MATTVGERALLGLTLNRIHSNARNISACANPRHAVISSNRLSSGQIERGPRGILAASQPSLTLVKRKNLDSFRVKAAQTVVTDPSSLTRAEVEKFVLELKEQLERSQQDLPCGKYGRDDDEMLEWFLRDRKFSVDAAASKLAKAIRWRYEFGVASLTEHDILEEAQTGKAYLHSSPAIDGRPVIIVAAAKHFPDEARLRSSEQLCVFLIEKAIAQLPPGEDKFLGIFDLRGFGHKNADITFVKFLIDAFFNYYPKRLHRVLFVDAPYIFQPGWQVMKPLLKSYASLVEFCSAEDVREKYFTPETVPESFKK